MRKFTSIFKTVAAFFFAILYFFRNKRVKIPFDREKALVNIRPFDTLMNYAAEFRKKWEATDGQLAFDKETFPQYITYNRDAFIALINAPKAEKIRIYFGLGSSAEVQASGKSLERNDNVILCIFPVDAQDNVIKAELVKDDRRYGDDGTQNGMKLVSVHPLLAMTAAAATSGKAQGVDDGQRQP